MAARIKSTGRGKARRFGKTRSPGPGRISQRRERRYFMARACFGFYPFERPKHPARSRFRETAVGQKIYGGAVAARKNQKAGLRFIVARSSRSHGRDDHPAIGRKISRST